MGTPQKKSRSKRPPVADVPMLPRPPSVAQTISQSSASIRIDENKKRSTWGLLLLLSALCLGGVAWWSEQTQSKQRQAASTDVQDPVARQRIENQVNHHVQMTNRKMELEKESIKVEASFSIPKVGQFVVDRDSSSQNFSLQGDRNELNAARDLRNDRQLAVSASDIIQGEMVNQQYAAEPQSMDEEYRREYARQFIENARRNGYEVTLSPDLRVIGVQQLPSGEAYR